MEILNIIISIYIIGIIVSIVLLIHSLLEDSGEITVKDITLTLLLSTFSWISIIAILCMNYEDVVVFRKKRKINN